VSSQCTQKYAVSVVIVLVYGSNVFHFRKKTLLIFMRLIINIKELKNLPTMALSY
jgi:hypothetical protein